MPRPADRPEPNRVLPHPDLNPLLNPVLGAHMGRWAEVYFTNPPEKRDQAVIELLRELVAESQPVFGGSAEQILPEISPEREQACASCGENNPVDQKFCGMCGAGIGGAEICGPEIEERAAAASRPAMIDPVPDLDLRNSWGIDRTSIAYPIDRKTSDRTTSDRTGNTGPRLIPDYEPETYHHRVYVGAALAILLSAFIYMSWRSAQAGLRVSRPLPPVVSAATSDAATTSRPPATTRQSSPGGSGRKKDSVSSVAQSPARRSAPVSAASIPASASSATQSASGNGTEELAIAETYLNGASGRARDDSEAAKWLWKSVAKHNSRAAVMLSDLYLRGSGVSKNCDQARLLLDAAARKSTAGAEERLRNLQAFGCQ